MPDEFEKYFTARGAEFFGIIQSVEGSVRVQNDGRDDDRTGQGPAARFIDARDPLLSRRHDPTTRKQRQRPAHWLRSAVRNAVH